MVGPIQYYYWNKDKENNIPAENKSMQKWHTHKTVENRMLIVVGRLVAP